MKNHFAVEPLEIVEILKDVESGAIQLPRFQRGYNWSTGAVLKLLESIHKRHPSGSLLFLETTKPKTIVGYEPIRTVDNEKLSYPEYLILDGQQRITSCHAVFYNKGSYSYYISLSDIYRIFKDKDDLTLDDYDELDLIEDENHRIIVAKKHSEHPDEFLFKSDLLPLSFLRDPSIYRKKIFSYKQNLRESDGVDKAYVDFLDLHLDNFVDPFFQYKFPVIKLYKDLSIEGVCKIFQTINSTGLKLTAFDICVASFMPFDIDLKLKTDKVIDEKDRLSVLIDSERTIILQTIALLAGVSPKKNGLPKNLEADHIRDEWEGAIEGLNLAVELLDEFGVGLSYSTKIVPYKPMIPVLAAALAKKQFKDKLDAEQGIMIHKCRQWFFKACLENRYTEGTDNKMQLDFTMLKRWFDSGSTPVEMSNPIHLNINQASFANKNGAFGKAILVALNSVDLKDFLTLSDVGYSDNSTLMSHVHHIFPKSKYGSNKLVDSVFNFTFLENATNISIKNSSPSDYLTSLRVNQNLSEQDLKERLGKHFIDESCYTSLMNDDINTFITHRILRFAKYFQDEIGLDVQVTGNKVSDDQIDLDGEFELEESV
ncbi:MAG: DUF262 domain-containing protein [Flavobacteriales bacterium]|nr:DUF262 domain-containing protein [Flavobacteriales bacterium]